MKSGDERGIYSTHPHRSWGQLLSVCSALWATSFSLQVRFGQGARDLVVMSAFLCSLYIGLFFPNLVLVSHVPVNLRNFLYPLHLSF